MPCFVSGRYVMYVWIPPEGRSEEDGQAAWCGPWFPHLAYPRNTLWQSACVNILEIIAVNKSDVQSCCWLKKPAPFAQVTAVPSLSQTPCKAPDPGLSAGESDRWLAFFMARCRAMLKYDVTPSASQTRIKHDARSVRFKQNAGFRPRLQLPAVKLFRCYGFFPESVWA